MKISVKHQSKKKTKKTSLLYCITHRPSWEPVPLFLDSNNWDEEVKTNDCLQKVKLEVLGEENNEDLVKKEQDVELTACRLDNDDSPLHLHTDDTELTVSTTQNSNRSDNETSNEQTNPVLSAENRYECSKCDKQFSSNQILRKHLRLHEEGNSTPILKKKICIKCKKSFNSSYHLNRHISALHGSFPCLQCEKKFPSKISLKAHLNSPEANLCRRKSLHSSNTLAESVSATARTENGSSTGSAKLVQSDVSYNCTLCDKQYSSKYHLKRHMASHEESSEHVCIVCKKVFNTAYNLRKHSILHEEKNIPCPHCPKMFPDNDTLKSHARYHLQEKRHKCLQCGKAFLKRSKLIRHMLVHNKPPDSPVECPHCHKTFATKLRLENHLRCTADGKYMGNGKYIICRRCNESFPNKMCYKNHICVGVTSWQKSEVDLERSKNNRFDAQSNVLPSANESYKCPRCGKQCSSSSGLKAHIKVHDVSNLGKINCPHCFKTFKTKSGLNGHLKLATNEEGTYCSRCCKLFPSKICYMYHACVHVTEDTKKFACLSCSEKFEDLLQLRMHTCKNVLDGECTCVTCGCPFPRKNELENHVCLPPEMKSIRLVGEDTNTTIKVSKRPCRKTHEGTASKRIITEPSRNKEKESKFNGVSKRTISVLNKETSDSKPKDSVGSESDVMDQEVEAMSALAHRLACGECHNCTRSRSLQHQQQQPPPGMNPAVEKIFVCSRCGRGCLSKTDLNVHVLTCSYSSHS